MSAEVFRLTQQSWCWSQLISTQVSMVNYAFSAKLRHTTSSGLWPRSNLDLLVSLVEVTTITHETIDTFWISFSLVNTTFPFMESGNVVLGKFTVFRKLLLAQRLHSLRTTNWSFRSDILLNIMDVLLVFVILCTKQSHAINNVKN